MEMVIPGVHTRVCGSRGMFGGWCGIRKERVVWARGFGKGGGRGVREWIDDGMQLPIAKHLRREAAHYLTLGIVVEQKTRAQKPGTSPSSPHHTRPSSPSASRCTCSSKAPTVRSSIMAAPRLSFLPCFSPARSAIRALASSITGRSSQGPAPSVAGLSYSHSMTSATPPGLLCRARWTKPRARTKARSV